MIFLLISTITKWIELKKDSKIALERRSGSKQKEATRVLRNVLSVFFYEQ